MANDLELQGTTVIYENCQDDVENVLKTFVPSHWIYVFNYLIFIVFVCLD